MTDTQPGTPTSEAPGRPRLGEPIALCDLLALPSDGRRYARDDQGRLALMAPDHAPGHGYPLTSLHHHLIRSLTARWDVLQERGLALDPILDLQGRTVPPSRLGRKTLEPDLAVFEGRPTVLPHRPGTRMKVFSPRGLRLVIELLSRDTYRSDLGRGAADQVDRWRTYLVNHVPEYWVLNADTEALGLPARSGLFLANDGGRAWSPLPVEGAEAAGAELEGLTPLRAGVVRSHAVPGLTLDLAAFLGGLDLEDEPAGD